MSEFTRAEAIAYLLGRECHACGSALAGPGEPCEACGAFPPVTAPELETELTGPRTVAAVHAAALRKEAGELRSQMLARYMEADRVLHMARLEERRALAQSALAEALTAAARTEAPLKAAHKAEAKAARELAKASAEHDEIARAEETARRMKHGVRAETEAALRLAEAGKVLARYQAALAEVSARREVAESALAAARAQVGQLEAIRDQAAADVDHPGRIPVSPETVTADPVRLLLTGQLDEVETLMAQIPGRFIAAMTGLSDDIEAQARAQLKAEQEREARERPLWLQPLGNGSVGAVPNPSHPATPQQYHPPGGRP